MSPAERLTVSGFAAVAAAHLTALLLVVGTRTYFVGDDFYLFWLAHTAPLRQGLWDTAGGVLSPLHRVAYYALYQIAPLGQTPALVVLAGFHIAGVAVLYALLRRLGLSAVATGAISGAYAVSVFAAPLYAWVAAGLHRFPFALFALLSLRLWLWARQSNSSLPAAAIATCVVAAAGFYPKGGLIPLYLIGLEVCLSRDFPPVQPLRRWGELIALCAIGGASVAAGMVATKSAAVPVGGGDAISYLLQAWNVFLHGTLGVLSHPTAPPAYGLVVIGLWLALVLYTIVRRTSAAIAWAVCAGLVTLNLALPLMSNRWGMFSEFLVYAVRYYFDLGFLLAVFAGLAWRSASGRRTELRSPWQIAAGRAAVLIGLVAIAVISNRSFASFLDSRAATATRPYFDRLSAGLAEIAARGDGVPRFVDGPIPQHINRWDPVFRRHSQLLNLLGFEAEFVGAQRAEFRIAADGSVESIGR